MASEHDSYHEGLQAAYVEAQSRARLSLLMKIWAVSSLNIKNIYRFFPTLEPFPEY